MFGKRSASDIPAFGDAHFASRDEMEAAALLGDEGIRLGYYRVPGHPKGWGQVVRYNGDGGLMMVAPPRTGKARDVLVGALLEYQQSCIVIDPKGQLAAITKARRERPKNEGGLGQRVIVLNPFNVWPEILGPSAHYNPMSLLDPTQEDWDADCMKLAEGLIARDNEKDSHWTDRARTLLTGIIGQLAAHGREGKKNLAEVRRILTEDFEFEDPETKKTVIKPLLVAVAQAAKNSPHAFIRQSLAGYANEDPRNAGELESFKENAKKQTEFLGMETMARNLRGDGDFRFADLKEQPTTVYIILPDNRLDICGKWFRLVVASALDDLWRGEKGTYRVLAILDEFAQIGHLNVLENAAGAAAGRGVQLWPVIQNIPQLKKDYGEVWETFLSSSDIRQFFAPRDQTTAKYVSDTVGQRTVTTAGQSNQNASLFHQGGGSSDSSGQAGQPLIRPHEISGLGPNESLVIGPRNIVVDGLRQPYFHTPEFKGLYCADPMHKRDAAPPPPINPDSIKTFADTLAAAADGGKKRPGALHGLLGVLHGKLGWAVVTIIAFVPLAVWEIWVKTPWQLHQTALAHIYSNEALQKDPNGGGNPVESQNKAFFDTLSFFTHEALALPGGLYHSVFGSSANVSGKASSSTLSDIRADFSKKVDAKVAEGTVAAPMSPANAVQIIQDDLDASIAAIGKNLHSGSPVPVDHRTMDEKIRDQQDCLKKARAMQPRGAITVTPDDAPQTDTRVPTDAEQRLAEQACYTGSLTNPYGLSTPQQPSQPAGMSTHPPTTAPPYVSTHPPAASAPVSTHPPTAPTYASPPPPIPSAPGSTHPPTLPAPVSTHPPTAPPQ